MNKTQELIDKYRIMVGNLVYDTESERAHKHIKMILDVMNKDYEKSESVPDSK